MGSVEAAVEAIRAANESLGMLAEVTHTTWPSQDSMGAPKGAPVVVVRKAFVAEGEQQHNDKAGRPLTVKACLVFFPEVEGEAPPAFKRQDEIVLPSGTTGVIVDIDETYVNPAGHPVLRTVWLG